MTVDLHSANKRYATSSTSNGNVASTGTGYATGAVAMPAPVPPPEATRPTIRLGRTIPLVLVVWLAIDIGSRLLPLHWLDLYPFQTAVQWPGRYAPFGRNLQLEMRDYPGELALTANLRRTEHRPPVKFTSDDLGFRATPGADRNRPLSVLLMEGDSFTFGAALSDEETLAASLTRRIGAGVYNAGRMFSDPERPQELDWLLQKLGANRPHTVVYVQLEHPDLFVGQDSDRHPVDKAGAALFGNPYVHLRDYARYLRRRYMLWSEVAPVAILTKRAYKWLSDDRVLPNAYREYVVERTLPDGSRFLVDPRFVRRYRNPPGEAVTERTAEYLAWMRDRLRERDLSLVVLLVPESVSVYDRWLLSPVEQNRQHYYHRLADRLKARDIPVLNGLDVLRKDTEQDIASGTLSYYREDHHWSPVGVERIADALARFMDESGILAGTRKPSSDQHALRRQ